MKCQLRKRERERERKRERERERERESACLFLFSWLYGRFSAQIGGEKRNGTFYSFSTGTHGPMIPA